MSGGISSSNITIRMLEGIATIPFAQQIFKMGNAGAGATTTVHTVTTGKTFYCTGVYLAITSGAGVQNQAYVSFDFGAGDVIVIEAAPALVGTFAAFSLPFTLAIAVPSTKLIKVSSSAGAGNVAYCTITGWEA